MNQSPELQAHYEEALEDLSIGEDRWRRITKVKVSKKCLTFECVTNEKYITRITFRKNTTAGVDRFTMDVEESKPVVKTERCSLGHEHVVSEKVARDFVYMRIDWQHAERLMEWFEQGTWSQVRQRRES